VFFMSHLLTQESTIHYMFKDMQECYIRSLSKYTIIQHCPFTSITLVTYFSLILLQLLKRSSIFHRKLWSLCLAEEFDQTQLTHICLQQFKCGCEQFYLAHGLCTLSVSPPSPPMKDGLHKVRDYLTLTTWANDCLLTQIQELGKISPLIHSGTC
jgi:hypothetical protein